MAIPKNTSSRLKVVMVSVVVVLLLSEISVKPAEAIGIGLSLGAAGAAVAGMFGVHKYGNSLWCSLRECCPENWAEANMKALQETMKQKVYGQHLAEKVVLDVLKGHIENRNPAKALVLSFHGTTGIGKTFVSRIIAESLFKNGMSSKHVHVFSTRLHFLHESNLPEYKNQLQDWVSSNISTCGWQMFIFDETDEMQPGLIDVLKPFLDYFPEIDGVDYRKSIYIFLSNSGGREISQRTLQQFEDGKKREDITLKEMDELLKQMAFNEPGGLWHSDLLEKNLISFMVPFLPLERSHVLKCIQDDLRAKKFNLDINNRLSNDRKFINQIADELAYRPKEINAFSETGCKRVPEKVDLILNERKRSYEKH
ncbi:torsin-1A-like [Ptychodera flava]|uniref:torsin-1A-like n=1 Tax=Ptychodera flava TaxID=63121 RepID=UPI00396A9A15